MGTEQAVALVFLFFVVAVVCFALGYVAHMVKIENQEVNRHEAGYDRTDPANYTN